MTSSTTRAALAAAMLASGLDAQQLTNLPANVAALFMGWSRITPGLALDGLGMPGCAAHVSLDRVALLVGADSTAQWSLPVPFQPALRGLSFHVQALVFDPLAGNAMSAVVSDASSAVVGG